MPKRHVVIKGYNGEGSLVLQRSMSLTRWYEELHPVIDSNRFRHENGIVRVEGLKYDAEGKSTNWVTRCRLDGSAIGALEFRDDGSLLRSTDFWEDGSIKCMTIFGSDGSVEEKREYMHEARLSGALKDVDDAQLNLFSD